MSQKQELENEAKAKFEKHVNELSLLMRCRNNPLCNESKPCDKCDKFSKSFKKDLKAKYFRKLANIKSNDLTNNQAEEYGLGLSANRENEIDHQVLGSSSQGMRITRLRQKGLIQ